jgi:hypothetical protein
LQIVDNLLITFEKREHQIEKKELYLYRQKGERAPREKPPQIVDNLLITFEKREHQIEKKELYLYNKINESYETS